MGKGSLCQWTVSSLILLDTTCNCIGKRSPVRGKGSLCHCATSTASSLAAGSTCIGKKN
jgi:hypothetical protein